MALLLILPLLAFPSTVANSPSLPSIPLHSYHQHLQNLAVTSGGSTTTVATTLSSLLSSWTYFLPLQALRKGTAYTGSSHRLRRAVHDMMRGNAIKIGVIGGSITWGDKASRRGVTDWVSLLSKWLGTIYPSVRVRNGAIPGTPSSYMVMCLEHSVDQDVDIVFAEYNLNDGFKDSVIRNHKTKGYEKLIRRVLALPNKPALVLLQVMTHASAVDPDVTHWRPFHMTQEDVYGALAQYYSVQWLSFRAATYRLAALRPTPPFTYKELMENLYRLHPTDPGHKAMADLAVWLLQQTAIELVLRPWDSSDNEQMAEPLPAPMIPGNEVSSSPMCIQGDMFPTVVQSAKGWVWVNEGTATKPKKGYVSNTTGSTLRLSLDTLRPDSSSSERVTVSLGYMASYEHMGKAVIRCESGCDCEERVVDAHQQEHSSQVFLVGIQTSQHAQCILSVTILNETSSGEHKFKVSTVSISDTTKSDWIVMDGHYPVGDFLVQNSDLLSDPAPRVNQTRRRWWLL